LIKKHNNQNNDALKKIDRTIANLGDTFEKKIIDTERICKKDAARVAELAAKKYKSKNNSKSNAGSNANVASGIDSSTSKSGTNLMVKSSQQILSASPTSVNSRGADNVMTMRPANSEGCMSKPSEASDSPKHANGLGSLVNMNKVFNNTIK